MNTPNQKVILFLRLGAMAYGIEVKVQLSRLQARVEALERVNQEMGQTQNALREKLGDPQHPRLHWLGDFVDAGVLLARPF